MTQTAIAGAPDTTDTQTLSPWLTVEKAAVYSGYSYETIRRLCVDYRRDNNRGIRCTQRVAGAHYRIHRDDLDRWLDGKSPARGSRRFTSE